MPGLPGRTASAPLPPLSVSSLRDSPRVAGLARRRFLSLPWRDWRLRKVVISRPVRQKSCASCISMWIAVASASIQKGGLGSGLHNSLFSRIDYRVRHRDALGSGYFRVMGRGFDGTVIAERVTMDYMDGMDFMDWTGTNCCYADGARRGRTWIMRIKWMWRRHQFD